MRAGRYAAIDIGTVTCRLLVAEVSERGVSDIERGYAITNLGEGVDASGFLLPEAIDRVAKQVGIYAARCRELSSEQAPLLGVGAVATSAARDAANAQDLVSALREQGVDLSVISGAREASLTFSGASSCFAGEIDVVLDVGGGSTEIIVGEGGKTPLLVRSFNVGCRRVTERFLASDPPAPGEIEHARRWLREQMEPWFEGSFKAKGLAFDRIVAVAGTATSVVSIRDAMEVYDASRVHKAQVTRSDLDVVFERLSTMPLAERRRVVGLDPDRAPVIVAGFLILQTVLDLAGADGFTVSESDILHGIVLAEANKALPASSL